MKSLSLPRPDVERVVLDELARALGEERDPAELDLRARLRDDLGLTSVNVVGVVRGVASRLLPDGRQEVALTDVRTVDDLCRAFSALVAGEAAGVDRDPELLASLHRGRRRRQRSGV